MVYGGKFSLTKAKVNPFIVQTLSFLKDGVLGISEMCDYLCTILLDLSEVFTTLCDFILSRIRVLRDDWIVKQCAECRCCSHQLLRCRACCTGSSR